MKKLLAIMESAGHPEDTITLHDSFDIELNEHFVIETGIVGFTEDGIIIEADETILGLLEVNDILIEGEINQIEQPQQPQQPRGTKLNQMNPIDRYEMERQKKAAGMPYDTRIDSVRTPQDIQTIFGNAALDEAEYQGRKVPLGKPMAGDVKKSKVYVRKPNGKVVKVNFGDKKMKIKKSNPKRRKSFRARHHCENPGPRWKARYWSCRAW